MRIATVIRRRRVRSPRAVKTATYVVAPRRRRATSKTHAHTRRKPCQGLGRGRDRETPRNTRNKGSSAHNGATADTQTDGPPRRLRPGAAQTVAKTWKMLELMGRPYPYPGLPPKETPRREGKAMDKLKRRSGLRGAYCGSPKVRMGSCKRPCGRGGVYNGVYCELTRHSFP